RACVSLEWAVGQAMPVGGCFGGYTINRIGQAHAAAVDRVRNSGRALCAQVFLPGVSVRVRGLLGFAGGRAEVREGVRGNTWREPEWLPVHVRIQRRRTLEDVSGTRTGLVAGQPVEGRRIEQLVL